MMYKANVKRSLRGADAAQERDHVGFVVVDGDLEGSAAVTAAQRVGDNSNARWRAGQSIEPVLRGHIRFDLHQKFANLQVPVHCRHRQRGALTAGDVRGREGDVRNIEPRVGAEAEHDGSKKRKQKIGRKCKKQSSSTDGRGSYLRFFASTSALTCTKNLQISKCPSIAAIGSGVR